MLRGGFPGQEEAFREAIERLKASRDQATRRGVLAAAASALVFGGGGYLLGACAGGATAVDGKEVVAVKLDPGLAPFREMATGPLDKLVAARHGYLTAAVDASTHDRLFWLGVARLASAAVEGHPGGDRPMRAALLILRDRNDLPFLVSDWLELLAAQPR